MRAAWAICLLLISVPVAGLSPAPAPPDRIETAYFAGKRYLRAGDWARANKLEVRWMKQDEVFQLTNRSCNLVFARDSRNAEVSGVNVNLSYPVVLKNGAGYIAETDIETAIRPVLSPPLNWGRSAAKNIVIDPGHGGKDPGNQDGAQQEKKYTLLLAQELRDQLKKAGFNASLTRTTDTYIDPFNRPEIANRRGADLFICLHWNSTENGRNQVHGIETYCLTPAGASSSNAGGEIRDAGTKPGNRNNARNMFLAYTLQKTLVKNLGLEDRGVRRARFAVLRGAEMPAVLIEGGYMSHPTESRRIYDAAYRRQMAQAIVEGILAYNRQLQPATTRQP